MTINRDPIEAALRRVRSTTMPPGEPDERLERRLMRAHDARLDRQRRVRASASVFAAVLALGGAVVVAPAAVEAIRGWLLRVDINGVATDVELDPSGAARLTVDTEAGPADVVIEKSSDEDGGHRTFVSVTSDGLVAEEEAIVRPGGDDGVDRLLPAELDLSAARPLAEWIDEHAVVHVVLARPDADEAASELLLVSHAGPDGPEIRRLTRTAPLALSRDDGVFDVHLDELGVLRITVRTAPDDIDILKFRLGGSVRADRPGALRVTAPGLDLRVPLDPLPPSDGG